MVLTNKRFLDVVLAGAGADERGWIASIADNPKTAPPRAWFGQPIRSGDIPPVSAHANNYFCISSFKDNKEGRVRRSAECFAALHTIVLDDVGTKAQEPGIEPSWKLETSPGNFQHGYLLETPITDPKLASQVMRAVISAGFCDPGASGPTTRYARLPAGINSKCGVFQCHMHSWRPDLRYSIAEFLNRCGLSLLVETEKPKPRRRHMSGKQQVRRYSEALALIGADDYSSWLICLKGLKGAMMTGELTDEARRLWLEVSQPCADRRYDPEVMWANWSPTVAPPDALVGALMAKARDTALDRVRTDTVTGGELSPDGLKAARYLARYHKRAFNEVMCEVQS